VKQVGFCDNNVMLMACGVNYSSYVFSTIGASSDFQFGEDRTMVVACV